MGACCEFTRMCYDVPNDAEFLLIWNGISNTKREIPTSSRCPSSLKLVAPSVLRTGSRHIWHDCFVVSDPERAAASGWIRRKEIF